MDKVIFSLKITLKNKLNEVIEFEGANGQSIKLPAVFFENADLNENSVFCLKIFQKTNGIKYIVIEI